MASLLSYWIYPPANYRHSGNDASSFAVWGYYARQQPIGQGHFEYMWDISFLNSFVFDIYISEENPKGASKLVDSSSDNNYATTKIQQLHLNKIKHCPKFTIVWETSVQTHRGRGAPRETSGTFPDSKLRPYEQFSLPHWDPLLEVSAGNICSSYNINIFKIFVSNWFLTQRSY